MNTRHLWGAVAFFLMATLGWAGELAGPAAAHELTAQDAEAWLDGLLHYGLENGDIAGAEVSIVKDGKVLFESGYGYADVEQKTSMDPERNMMRIGSTSKLFTWVAVMQLVEQGKIGLDRNVDDYLDFKVSPPGGKPITVLDLMNHRGGFEEGLKDILALNPKQLQSTETYLKRHPRPLLFPAGSVPAYSNYGAALAGYIVQRVSGEPFERYVEHHIFQPLKMPNTTFEQPLPDRYKGMPSQGYRSASTPAQPYELIATAPAGSVASTAADMARFMLANLAQGHLDGAEILSPKSTELMHSPSSPVMPGFASLAHGFFHETRNGKVLIGHGGDSIFFHTELDLLPQQGVGIFYSFNSRGRDSAVYALRKAVIDQFMDRYFPAQAAETDAATLPTAAADAQKIAGRYETSRRVEHGFLSVFYLLQQTVLSANADGTVNAPKEFDPGVARFREVAPEVWREIGGDRQLALTAVNGTKTVIESGDPTSVLQAVPTKRSASLNLSVLIGSLLVLTVTVVLWPVAFLARRHYQRPAAYAPEVRRGRRLIRSACAFGLLWLAAWAMVLSPVLSVQLDFYGAAHDGLIRTLQVAGLALIALIVLALVSLWRLNRTQISLWPRLGNGLLALSLLGLIWIGFIGGLLSFNLNY